MYDKYYDTNDAKVKTWQEQASQSGRFPYGLGLDSAVYLASVGVYPYREYRPVLDTTTQELIPETKPQFIDGWYVLHYNAVSLPASVIVEKRGVLVREERDKRLAATDYLLATDYPISVEDKNAWMLYRQSLRDLPNKVGFPWQGVIDAPWPVKP